MDLLYAQFNSGRLSLAQIKTVLGVDFGSAWPLLQEKFKKDDNDNYYNQRAELEKEKRKKFTESRQKNLKSSHMGNHMASHMVNANEDEIVIKDRGPGKGWNTQPGKEDWELPLSDHQVGATIELFGIMQKKSVSPNQIETLWKIFKVQNFTAKNFYKDDSEPFSHFLHWCKKMDVKDIPPQEQKTVSLKDQKTKDLLNSLD